MKPYADDSDVRISALLVNEHPGLLPRATPLGAALAAIMSLAACGEGESDSPSQPTKTGGIRDELLIDSSTMMQWISEIVAQGIRRPGYPADEWVEGWIRDQFIEIGLEEVSLQPLRIQRWEPLEWELRVWNPDVPDEQLSLPCYPVPFSGATDGIEAELAVAVEAGEEVAGKVVVIENTMLALPQTVLAGFATWVHDPAGEVATHTQTLPFASGFQGVMDPWVDAGAAGFIGILRGLPWETDRYYVPYNDGKVRPIPGVWLSSQNGDRLLAFLGDKPGRARLKLRRTLEPATSHHVTGVLRGASDEWIIIGSHHDGPWASAVEDGSGIALVLAQARYWARVPEQERPHNLLFLLQGGHMGGWISGDGPSFVDSHRSFVEQQVVVEIHLEHAAREARGENGKLIPTDSPVFRWWFTSLISPLEETVARALCAEDLGRSLIMPPEGFPPGSEHPPTDAAFFHPLSPIVNFLTAPVYLFDEADTIEMVHEPSLVPLTRAAIRIIEDMREHSAPTLRAAVYTPPRATPIAPCEQVSGTVPD
jgi:hypothetical protein